MIQSMFNGVSGLRAHKTQMDIIANNIANINTIGYKSSRVNFREMFNQTMRGATAPRAGGSGGTNPMQIGLGVSVGSIDVNLTQGSLQPTGKPTDCAIEGDGFFMVGDGMGKYYTRDGGFTLDADGNLVTASSGMKVLGWTADTTTAAIDTTQPVIASSSIRIPVGQLAIARQTTRIAYGGNIDANTVPGGSYTVSAQVYDSLGASHPLSLSFARMSTVIGQGYADQDTTTVGAGQLHISVAGTNTDINVGAGVTLEDLRDAINASAADVTAQIVDSGSGAQRYKLEVSSKAGVVTLDSSDMVAGGGTVPTFTAVSDARWYWEATSTDADPSSTVGNGVVTFDESGKSNTPTFDISLELAAPGGATSPLDMEVYFPPITMLAGESTLSPISQDGLPLGVLDSFTIGRDGIISGSFTNGMSQSLGQISMATFSNASGLRKGGSSLWMETPNSGIPQIGQPSVGSMGKITSGHLEASNVDLPAEFAGMIVAQRGFQANSRIISTSDEILQELVQLKR